MTFTLNRSQLAKELALLQSAAERKVTIPILATVLTQFDGQRCRLTVSDCSVTMQTEVEASGEPWSGCIPLRQFAALSRLFEGEAVTITERPNSRVEVKCGQSKHVLPIYPATDFPETDKIREAVEVQVNGDALRLAIKQILPSIDNQESRYALQGVNAELSANLLQLVSTDSHRLSAVKIPITNEVETKALIAAQGLPSLLRLDGDVTLRLTPNHAQFQCDNRVLTTRLLVGTFPNWEMIMPKEQPHSIEFDSEAMQSALRRVDVTREEKFKTGTGAILGGVRLDLHSDKLRVTTNYNDKGESEEWVAATSNLNGESVAVGINPDYLNDYLTQIEGQVRCEFRDGSSQLLLTSSAAPNYRYVVMPIRL